MENQSTITVRDEWKDCDVNVYSGSIGSKKVLLTTESRTLIRAFAQNCVKVYLIGKVVAAKSIENNSKYVSVIDYINLDGLIPLVGRNKSGLRFPDMSFPYHEIKGLPKVTAFSVIDANEVTNAYAKFIESFGGCVACEFGVKEAVVSRHADGNISFLGIVHSDQNDEWSVDDEVLMKAIE